ncbi:MAG: MOSC domain-containing protein [Planctomycetes bacterium]|nr:MOSC domain-containing protein [Planctomycetota bacterium]
METTKGRGSQTQNRAFAVPRIRAISISKERGTRKRNVAAARLKAGFGIAGDAHAGDWHRQVSLLAQESIATMRAKGADVGPGDFAENITTEGIDLQTLTIGSKLRLGSVAELEVTQFGKKCHSRCEIFQQVGDCVMPREGIFARVTKPGRITPGDTIEVVNQDD